MHIRVMLIRLWLGWGLAALPGLLFAQTPPEQMDAYIALVRAEASMRDGDTRQAVKEMEAALDLYQKIADGYPGWNPEVIAYRITYCRNALARLQHSDPVPLEAMEPREEPVSSPPPSAVEDGEGSVPDPRLTELEQVIQSLTEEREQMQAEVDGLRKQVEEQARTQEKQADKAVKSLERELSDARKSTMRLQQTVSDLEAEKQEWTDARDRLVATHDEAAKAWRTEKKSLEGLQRELEKQVEALTRQTGRNADAWDEEKTRLHQAMDELTAQLAETAADRDMLKQQAGEQAQALEASRKLMAHDAREAARASQRLSQEIASLQDQLAGQLEREENLRAEIAALKEQHSQVVGNLEEQVTELRALVADKERAHQAIVQDLEASLASARSGEALEEMKEAERQIAYWQEHARALQETVDLQAAELSQPARRELRELSRENRELRARISVLEMGRHSTSSEPTNP
ncbi:MAG: hypothetical protein KDL31_06685 [Kiritimatiellae bacterium]|nr:hypothetical protein [Kiritimatiellia bacterium]